MLFRDTLVLSTATSSSAKKNRGTMSTYLPSHKNDDSGNKVHPEDQCPAESCISNSSRWLLISRKCLPLSCCCLINVVGAYAAPQQNTEHRVSVLITATAGIL